MKIQAIPALLLTAAALFRPAYAASSLRGNFKDEHNSFEAQRLLHSSHADFCWRDSYGRGVGTTINSCPSNRDKIGALCYSKCPSGWNRVGYDCHEGDRTTFFGWFRNIIKGRVIIGDPIPLTCPPGKQYDAGLCYNSCRAGYKGAGPVCWGQAPQGWVECGMGAAKSDWLCATTTGGQVMSVAKMGKFVSTLGTSSASAPAEAPGKLAAFITDLKAKFPKLTKLVEKLMEFFKSDMFKRGMQSIQVRNWFEEVGQTLALNQENGDISAADVTRLVATLISIFDPSGVSSTVGAYTHDICTY